MTTSAKVKRVLLNTSKILTVIGLLYFFICSLDLLSSSFRLISGRTAGKCINYWINLINVYLRFILIL